MAKTPEGEVKDNIKKALSRAGIKYSMKTTMGYGDSGWPDFDVVFYGVSLTIEAKADCRTHLEKGTKSGGPTKLQQITMAEIRDSGGITLIVDVFMLQQFVAFIADATALLSIFDSKTKRLPPDAVYTLAKQHGLLYEVDPRPKH